MRAQTSNPHLDDEGGQRESEVRHAHAVAASRHGRASAPGYLGIPVGDTDGGDADDRDEASGNDEARVGGTRRSARARGQGGARNGNGSHARNGNGGHARNGNGGHARNGNGAEQSRRSPGRRGSGPKGTSKRGSSAAKQAAKPRASRTAKATASKSGDAARASKQTGRKVTQTAERAAKGTADAARKVASSATGSSRGGVRGLARKELRRIVRHIAKEALVMSGQAAAKAARHVGETGIDAVAERVNRLPIQRSVDVAVPLEVAWTQWMELRHLPEGAKRVKDVEREGETLHGHIDGVGHEEWEAEVIDERENESFAWRSTQGSDSAGLVTFHELSERLTRIELELDVRPVHLVEAATLALHIADRRADSQLRRFKAEAELINPDCYEELLSGDGSTPEGDEGS